MIIKLFLTREYTNILNTIAEERISIKEELINSLEEEAKKWDMKEALMDEEKRNILFTISHSFKNIGNTTLEVEINEEEYNFDLETNIKIIKEKENVIASKAKLAKEEASLEETIMANKEIERWNVGLYEAFIQKIDDASTKQEARGWWKRLNNSMKDYHDLDEFRKNIEELKKEVIYTEYSVNYERKKIEEMKEKIKNETSNYKYENVINQFCLGFAGIEKAIKNIYIIKINEDKGVIF